MPKKPNLDPSNLLEEDPEFVQFVRIFCRYFYGRKWLKEELYRDASFYLGFPISLDPKDAAIPISKLADIFRYYLENGKDPDPEVLMGNLKFSPKRFFDSSLLCSPLGIEEKIREALKYHLHKSFCAALEEHRIWNPKKSTPDAKSITQFPSPEGLKFGGISWVFTSNDTVRIRAKSITKNFHFSQIGFKDGRTADTPDRLWGLLKGFALEYGEIDFDSTGKLTSKQITQMKANVKRLRKKLKAIFVLDEDPFEPYRRTEEDPAGEVQRITTKSYKLKMSIRDETNG